MMRLELRLSQICKVCELEVDPVSVRPHDPLTGKINIAFCVAMGICPCCLTSIEYYPIDWKKLMRRYRRTRKTK